VTQPSIADAVADLLGVAVAGTRPVQGGDVARAFRVRLADGTTVLAETHYDPPPGFFSTEAVGLGWLADAVAVPTPEVLAVSDGPGSAHEGPLPLLVLTWIDVSTGAAPDERAFGRGLAALHAAGAPCFGRADRRPTGSRQLPNEPCATWAEFYATCRLQPLARLARDSGALDGATCDDIDAVADRLEQFGAADEPPARLHGDLWAGNRLVDRNGGSWLIDPAAHGGHREFDLAMMALFGGFGPEVGEAYCEVSPLADGWKQRQPLHQLAPLIVHAIKFGGGYVGATRRALDLLG